MARWRVYPQAVISTSVEVEAEDRDEAIEKALEEIPGVMFLNHTYPDVGEWDVPDPGQHGDDYVEELD